MITDAPWYPAAILLMALSADLLAGDPPTALHPVGWIGRAIYLFRRRAAGIQSSRFSFLAGACFMLVGAAAVGAISGAIEYGLRFLPAGIALPLSGLVLKGSLAFRSLAGSVLSVREALDSGNLPEAHRLLAWHLVSRPVDELDEAHVASAAIESAAENFADSVAAPLFWYLFLGLPGAWIYRFVDTADSILGYRDIELEWTGKAAARLDDAMCLIPARLSGWALVAASLPAGLDWKQAARVMRRDARKCSSPNSGWPMAAAAGALGLRLEKQGTYVLNPEGRSPDSRDITAAVRLLRLCLLLWAGSIAGLSIPAALLPAG